MRPDGFAGLHAIASDEFVLAALLLRDGIVADDRKRRPARADFVSPQFLRRMRLPIGFQLDALHLGPIAVAQETRIIVRRRLPVGRFTGRAELLQRSGRHSVQIAIASGKRPCRRCRRGETR